MNEKITYQTPEVELVEICSEGRFLTLSDGDGAQAPNVSGIAPGDIYVNPNW